MIMQKILLFIQEEFNLEICRAYPREAVKFATKYFKGKEVVVAEIGVYKGFHARSINKSLNVKKFYLIDPYSSYDYHGKIDDLDIAERKAHRKNNRWFETNRWIKEFSEKAFLRIEDNSLDFLYIDGNHNYNFVKRDLKLYWDKIKKGGILAGHDIQGKEVSDAVLDFVNENKLGIQFGERRDWWILKK